MTYASRHYCWKNSLVRHLESHLNLRERVRERGQIRNDPLPGIRGSPGRISRAGALSPGRYGVGVQTRARHERGDTPRHKHSGIASGRTQANATSDRRRISGSDSPGHQLSASRSCLIWKYSALLISPFA